MLQETEDEKTGARRRGLADERWKNTYIQEVHKICDVLHFLEIREMSLIFVKPGRPL